MSNQTYQKIIRVFEHFKAKYLKRTDIKKKTPYELGYRQGLSDVLSALNEIINEDEQHVA